MVLTFIHSQYAHSQYANNKQNPYNHARAHTHTRTHHTIRHHTIAYHHFYRWYSPASWWLSCPTLWPWRLMVAMGLAKMPQGSGYLGIEILTSDDD